MKVLILLVFISISQAIREDWIDPHEIRIKPKNVLKKSLSQNDGDMLNHRVNGKEEYRANTTPTVEETTSLMFLKRAVNLILNSASAEKDDPSLYTGSYQFKSDTEEYRFLKDFSTKEKVSVEDIRRLDTVLSAVFIKSYDSSFMNISREDIYSVLIHPYFLFTFGCIACLLIFYFLIKSHYGFLYIFSYFAFLVIVVDFGFRYKFLQEEADEHNFKLMYSANCDTDKMGWGEYLKFVTSRRDCEKRIITPLAVALNQLKYIIIIPLESFGTGMGKFGQQLWLELPFPWNIIIFPLILIFIILMTMALRDSSFKLNLMHLFHLEFGKGYDDSNKISGITLDKLLEATTVTHRHMIEETKSSPERKNVYKRSISKNKKNEGRKENLEKNGKNYLEAGTSQKNSSPKSKESKKQENFKEKKEEKID